MSHAFTDQSLELATIDKRRLSAEEEEAHNQPTKVSPVEESNSVENTVNYLTGWKLHILTIALCMALFLSSFELSVVSTSLVAITNDLKGFSQSSWVVTAYLLTYSGLLIIWAKISDIVGRKFAIIASICVFVAFSAACGAAQTITQLIICRAFQGIGGSGLYSLVLIIFFEMVPDSKWPTYTALVAAIFGLSLLVGPLIGGAINIHTTWRWVFYINIPAGCVAVALLIPTLPIGFPNHGQTRNRSHVYTLDSLLRVDFLGAFLLLGGSIFLVSALQEAANGKAWSSPLVISLLVLCGPLWISCLLWEWYITLDRRKQEPVLPWRFITSRVRAGLLLNALLIGIPFIVCLIQIPQRYQAVDGVYNLSAGVKLIPFSLLSPVGSALAAALMKRKVSPILILVAGGVFQTIGLSLLSTQGSSKHIPPSQYGYQILVGMGVGLNIAAITLMTPPLVDKRDLAVGTSAVVQNRLMGGSIGLAIVTAVFNNTIRPKLLQLLSLEQFQMLLQTTAVIDTLALPVQSTVRQILADGYNLQMKIIIGFGAAQIPAALLMWERTAKTTK